MKLHLGCGKRKFPGYVNLDINPDNEPDLIGDAFVLNNIPDNSVDTIVAIHILEHSGRKVYKDILKVWYNKLVPGGTLRLAVPNLERVFEHYIFHKNLPLLLGFLYGGQRNQWDYHYIGFDLLSLTADLCDIGFASVDEYDWRETDHAEIDDYSRSYLPHMQFDTGTLMSLNIEAIK